MTILRLLLCILAAIAITGIQAISPIEAVGSKFFTADGKQFFMKGIAYQLTEDDPLIDVDQCTRDAALMKQLGANAIRVYHVNVSADHTGCMLKFAEAGIYLFVDLDSFKTYIRYDTAFSWTKNKSDSYRAVIDSFHQFDNTAGFFVGNEVLNVIEDSGAAPYVLAAVVDTRAYRDARGYRKIPIGYSATDTTALPMLQDYFVCRPNETERLDFYALNSYRWCRTVDTFNTSGYNQLQEAAEGYPIPIFFSEVGCNTMPPREFNDQNAIFGNEMSNTWSGAIVYEWLEEMNGFGLISYGPKMGDNVQISSSVIQGFSRQGTPTPILPDFTNLQSRWYTLNPTGVTLSDYTDAIATKSRTCASSTAGGWTVDPSAPLPTLGQAELAGVTSDASASQVTATVSAITNGPHSSTASSMTTSASAAAAVKNPVNPLIAPLTNVGLITSTLGGGILIAVLMFWL